MNISEMKPGFQYVVVRGSGDSGLEVGDRVQCCNGGQIKNMSTRSAFKYINPKALWDEEVEIDPEWAASWRREAMNILAELEEAGL